MSLSGIHQQDGAEKKGPGNKIIVFILFTFSLILPFFDVGASAFVPSPPRCQHSESDIAKIEFELI